MEGARHKRPIKSGRRQRRERVVAGKQLVAAFPGENPLHAAMVHDLYATILKTLFTLLTNAQTYTASQGGVAAAIDPTPFAQETGLSARELVRLGHLNAAHGITPATIKKAIRKGIDKAKKA